MAGATTMTALETRSKIAEMDVTGPFVSERQIDHLWDRYKVSAAFRATDIDGKKSELERWILHETNADDWIYDAATVLQKAFLIFESADPCQPPTLVSPHFRNFSIIVPVVKHGRGHYSSLLIRMPIDGWVPVLDLHDPTTRFILFVSEPDHIFGRIWDLIASRVIPSLTRFSPQWPENPLDREVAASCSKLRDWQIEKFDDLWTGFVIRLMGSKQTVDQELDEIIAEEIDGIGNSGLRENMLYKLFQMLRVEFTKGGHIDHDYAKRVVASYTRWKCFDDILTVIENWRQGLRLERRHHSGVEGGFRKLMFKRIALHLLSLAAEEESPDLRAHLKVSKDAVANNVFDESAAVQCARYALSVAHASQAAHRTAEGRPTTAGVAFRTAALILTKLVSAVALYEFCVEIELKNTSVELAEECFREALNSGR